MEEDEFMEKVNECKEKWEETKKQIEEEEEKKM